MKTRLWTPTRNGASTLLLAFAVACSTLPPRRPLELEREIVATYDLSGEDSNNAAIRVPVSNDRLTIVWLQTEPPDLRESFDRDGRVFHATTGPVRLRCRYRAIQTRGDDGKLQPLATPQELFPGSSSIEIIEPPH